MVSPARGALPASSDIGDVRLSLSLSLCVVRTTRRIVFRVSALRHGTYGNWTAKAPEVTEWLTGVNVYQSDDKKTCFLASLWVSKIVVYRRQNHATSQRRERFCFVGLKVLSVILSMMPMQEQEAPLSLTSRVTQALCDCVDVACP